MARKTKAIDEVRMVISSLKDKLKDKKIHSLLLYSPEEGNGKKIIYIVSLDQPIDEDIVEELDDVLPEGYEVALFHNLPLHTKIDVIEGSEIIYSEDELELKEYFYGIRKLWEDQKERNEIQPDEVITLIKKSSMKIDKTKARKKVEELTSPI